MSARAQVEIVVLKDFDGYFVNLTNEILDRAARLDHVVRCKKIQIDARPYRFQALVVSQVDDETTRLDFYSALRNGFGELTDKDLDDAARLL